MEIIIKDTQKILLKENLNKGTGEFAAIKNELIFEAAIRFKNPEYSITFTKSHAASDNPHDYYSEAPYWWCDPKNPDGKYIRRDGEHNPDRFDTHREHMSVMAKDVYILSLAGYVFDKKEYSERAAYLLKVWFLDEATKMNPHLEYAQAIHKVTLGRGIGIIDTNELICVISAIDYLTITNDYEEIINGLKQWFSDYVNWMNTSKNGIEERDYFNNHANWWNTQAAAYSAFAGIEQLKNTCFERLKNVIIPNQTGENGEFTDELKRTNSFTYSIFNLNAAAVTAEIAHNCGVDLWNFELPDGRGIKKSLEFLLPFYENPFSWKNQQISGVNIPNQFAFQLASVRIDKKYGKFENKRRNGRKYFSTISHAGALCTFDGFNYLER